MSPEIVLIYLYIVQQVFRGWLIFKIARKNNSMWRENGSGLYRLPIATFIMIVVYRFDHRSNELENLMQLIMFVLVLSSTFFPIALAQMYGEAKEAKGI